MAKGKNRNRHQRNANGRPSSSAIPSASAPATNGASSGAGSPPKGAASVQSLAKDAAKAQESQGLQPTVSTEIQRSLEEMLKQAEAAKAAYAEAHDAAQIAQRQAKDAQSASEAATKEVAERSAALEELERSALARQLELDESCAEVDELHKSYESKLRGLDQRKHELDKREAEIDVRHLDLLTREQELEAGFTPWKREQLAALEAERAESRATIDRDRREAQEKLDTIRNETTRLTYELDERRSNRLLEIESEARERAEAICEQARSEASRILEERRAGLDTLERSLAEREERVEIDSEENERTRRRLERERERLPAELGEAWEHERNSLESQLRSLHDQRDRAEADAAGLRERVAAVESVLEGRGVEAVVELEKARKDNTREIAKLRKQLEAAPSQADADEVDRLREDVRNARASISDLQAQVVSISRERDELRLQIGERDAVRRERDVLRASATTLEHHVDKLEKQVHALKGRSDEHQVFPGCAKIVTDAATPPKSLGGELSSLSDFAVDVRKAMAALESPRYYSQQQVRAWLGGLASSRLQLLEGLSGTGKTSLPKAFAEAIGAGCRVVEVQAGWRDRNDLLGHYNAFEDRFEEMPFLHALVEAQQPQYAEQPYFIVLDEMNLSYVEHYFADLLSLLGAQDEGSGARRIQLLGRPLANLPAGIEAVAGQTMVKVPDNVFFVGTANQDETTKGFADKTYDRAMVMRLDRRAEAFKAARHKAQPVQFDALLDAFGQAADVHEKATGTLLKTLRATLQDPLEALEIGWGNRFESQFAAYVPVVLAAGGSTAEALDHLVASRLLRKLDNRFDLRTKQLEDLQAGLKLLAEEKSVAGSMPDATDRWKKAYAQACRNEGKDIDAETQAKG